MATLLQIINEIRENIDSWPITHELEKSITPQETTIKLAADHITDIMGDRALIQVGDEIMRVAGKRKKANFFNIIRGYQGTTKASHKKGDGMDILPPWGFSKHELVNLILPRAANLGAFRARDRPQRRRSQNREPQALPGLLDGSGRYR